MKDTLPTRVRFGVFELDLKAGELREGGRNILLQEQPFRILVMLLEARGEIVTREGVKNKLWPSDTIVEFDHSINAAIKNLRRALGDSADEPKYIETVARRGYRLMVPVERIAVAEDSPCEVVAQVAGGGAAVARLQAAAPVLIGQTVSHYRVLDIIGGGGMGVVYRAEDLKLGRRVALKFLPQEMATDALTLQRFEREAHTASSLNHPNICTIYEFGEHEGQPFLVMELLQGETLRDRLAAAAGGKGLPLEELLDIALQVTVGLQAAHEQGIIHRDIKPANIFPTNKGVCKILDFGLAKLLELPEPEADQQQISRGPNSTPTSPKPALVGGLGPPARDDGWRPATPVESALSRTGLAMGTAGYMSPEQVRGEKLDARSDLFSFGLVLYEMATGRRAFSGETAEIVHDAIVHQPQVPIRDVNSTLPPELEAIINKALEKDRGQRYRSAAEMHADLETVESSKSTIDRRRWRLFAAMLLIAVVVGGGLYWRSRTSLRLTDKDTIVLADFDNKTGDAVFDGTLRQGLSVQLEQSPFLALLSEGRVNKTLKLMGRPADDRLTPEVTREVCQRTGSKAMLTGSIAGLGSQYVIGLKAVNCNSGDVLAETQERAASKETVLTALDAAAISLRGKLGESLSSVQKYATPLEEATTPSLEALQAYTLGEQEHDVKNDDTAAIPLFQRAASLDPNFAMAYAHLGNSYANLNQTTRAADNARKAYELRERVSEREKFYIDSHYENYVTGNLETNRNTLELWAQTYPRDGVPRDNLGYTYAVLGDYDKILPPLQEAVRLKPDNATIYEDLVSGYVNVNRLSEARATAQDAQAHNLDSPAIHFILYSIDFMQHDAAGMERETAALMGKPGFEDVILGSESDTAAYGGQFAKAWELTRQASDSAQRADKKETAAGFEAEAAVREALVGNMGLARQRAQAALALSSGRDVKAVSAIALGLAGDVPHSTQLAADLAKRFPEDTIVQFDYLPMIHAAAAIPGSANKALEALAPAAPHELGSILWPWVSLYPVYLRGECYLAAHQGSAAASEFQKILDHPNVVSNELIGALARLGLARAYSLDAAKDPAARDKARTAYQNFLTLWKDADPDIPIYKQAKAEYAKLQ